MELHLDRSKNNSIHNLKCAFSGGLCCAVAHIALYPLDFVKIRIAINPNSFKSRFHGFRTIFATEGVAGVISGVGPYFVGHFLQGWLKFGGFEYFKTSYAKSVGPDFSWKLRVPIMIAASATTEFLADLVLCPLEAMRTRLWSDRSYASGYVMCARRILMEDGLKRGFYPNFGFVLAKQIPFTTAKFTLQDLFAHMLKERLLTESRALAPQPLQTNQQQQQQQQQQQYHLQQQPVLKRSYQLAVSLISGGMAGVSATLISHPVDHISHKLYFERRGGGALCTPAGFNSWTQIISEMSFKKISSGIGSRCAQAGPRAALQFLVFDSALRMMGVDRYEFIRD